MAVIAYSLLNEYQLTRRETKANVTKEKAISKVQAQKSSEEPHSLEVRLEAVKEFLSKGVGRSSSLFKAQKGETNEITYLWSMEAEEAFQRWKKCIELVTAVRAPVKGETLLLHLATPFNGISAILLAKRRKVQIPIYFASRVLQRPEQNYVESERLILALVHAARRLRRYFKDHPIRVLTNRPIEWVLLSPDRS
ncbi:reverse transcriptase domain-containing protein [Artemisia annua]|uniref:Reverse transcriptase domain-containing protein n=1 Tax=Artemisia annua TaxID=35608 RepID=A0A2U1L104_ARTAN|nr:reverse transcriptase domain-containing protein [Artemisia annua]